MKTILVVDDEFGNAELLCLILEEEGYRAFSAANGRQGLERARELRPDLAIVDYMMPVMNGAELGHALRADATTAKMRIVMNSALPESVVREHFDGYDAFLRKPYAVDAALALLAQLLAG